MARLSLQGRIHGVPANPTRQAHPQETSFQRPTHTTTEGLRRSPTSAEGALSAEEIILRRRVDSQPPGSLYQ
jgi:hypothetical protein